MLFQIKQESSDWPEWCIDDKAKQQYLDDYKQFEGISLEPDKICHNPGLRQTAKLCLNVSIFQEILFRSTLL